MLLPVSAVRTVCTDNNYNTHPAHACSPRFTHPISFMIRTVFITLVYTYLHDRPTHVQMSRCVYYPIPNSTLEHSARSQSVCVSSFVSQPGHRSPHCPPAVRTMLSTPPSTDNRYTPSGVSLTHQRSLTCPITTGRYPTVQYAETRASTTPHKYRTSPSIPYWTGGRRRASSSFHHRTSRRRPPVLGSLSHRRLPPRPVHATVCLPPRGGLRGASRWSDVVP